MKFVKGINSRMLVCLGLVMALALTALSPVASMEAQAVKKVTTNYDYRKAKAVKVGTTTVTAVPFDLKKPAATGFVKFKAPKAGTYQFTISKVTNKYDSADNPISTVTFRTGMGYQGSPYPEKHLEVKTKGGKTDTLWVCGKRTSGGTVTIYTPLTSRTATVKLKKGQLVFMDFNNSGTYTYSLKIKKK